MMRGLLAGIVALSTLALVPAAVAADAPAAGASTNAAGPRIKFAETSHDFGRAQSGEQVKYTYAFTNAGDQTLEVTGVHACGCITANWTKTVEPGQTGTIPMSFNSSGYDGAVTKMINVTCNDPSNRQPKLTFKGTVWKPIEAQPNRVFLNVPVGSPGVSATVHITNHMEEAITLSAPEVNNHSFKAELKTVEPGKVFEVVVSTVPPMPPGVVNGQLTLKTSATNAPVINLPVSANVASAISVTPSRIALPAAALQAPLTRTVTIVNNTSSALELSDPTVNVTNVDVQIKQVEAGHKFTATLTFPPGFELPHGKEGELTIKSSEPSVPLVKVPITQFPHMGMRPDRPIRPHPPGQAALGPGGQVAPAPAPAGP
jgi:hypothetical protein